MDLNSKQEKFVQGLVSGLSQREAYRKAYKCENASNKSIDERASRSLKNSKVLARYNELLDEHKSKALWTREQAILDLIWLKEQSKDSIKQIGVRQANSNAMLNSIKELNELEDLYTKSEVEEEYEDDGFLEALDGKEVVWDEEA